jgi:hypothetical protein
MSVARFEPFRDPFREFRSAIVHGRERDACPARYPHPRAAHRSHSQTADAIEHNLHTSSPRNPPPRRQNKPICAQHPGPNVETQPANIRRSASPQVGARSP